MPMVERAPPAAALAELKAHLRLEDGAEDALLAGWLRAATEAVEAELGQLLIVRGVEEVCLLRFGAVRPTLGPMRVLEAVELPDGLGGWRALDAGLFALKAAEPARVVLAGSAEGSEVRLRYRAGLGTGWNDLPELLRLAVVRLAAHFHANRDSGDAAGMPPAVRQLLGPQRVRRLL